MYVDNCCHKKEDAEKAIDEGVEAYLLYTSSSM
jgi:hypothetical protein